MKKIRLHIVNKYFFPVIAGIETNLMEVYGRLAKKGHFITMHTSTNTLSKNNILKRREIVQGIKVIRYPYEWFGFVPKIPLDKVDVISLHNFTLTPNMLLLIWISLVKILGQKKFALILSPHSGFNPDWDSMPKAQARIKRFIHQTIGKFLINYAADGIRAISVWEREELVKAGIRENLIELIGNGISKEALRKTQSNINTKFVNRIKSLRPYLVQIGRIHSIKNYETSIKAFSKVPKIYKLLIIGSIEQEDHFLKLQELIRNLNIEQRVVFLSGLTEAEKFYALENAELMIHMSRHEGYCIAVHEGMSKGLVCVVSNTTALPGLIKDGVNGYLVSPDNANKVFEKIMFIIKNKNSKKIKQISLNNLDFAKKVTWSQISEKVEKLYLSTLTRNYLAS